MLLSLLLSLLLLSSLQLLASFLFWGFHIRAEGHMINMTFEATCWVGMRIETVKPGVFHTPCNSVK